jgi:Cys-tRNA(Pro)/Cys-tRNA(Cys) deacylase
MLAPVADQATPATTLLARQKVIHRVHSYEHDPKAASYGAEAADALGVVPARCCKTQRKRLTTVVDESALDFETVFVSAGRRGLEIELSPGDLITLTGATVSRVRAAVS